MRDGGKTILVKRRSFSNFFIWRDKSDPFEMLDSLEKKSGFKKKLISEHYWAHDGGKTHFRYPIFAHLTSLRPPHGHTLRNNDISEKRGISEGQTSYCITRSNVKTDYQGQGDPPRKRTLSKLVKSLILVALGWLGAHSIRLF